ncbi:MAG: RluA family pseudouridine synthase [Proteobacteria bacterium]|nr:RluA family pseudouridine synthase [Desulfobulbaceae bacterium]MBU3915956.1 RluA family pseudouridine synthase [bacterium]MBU4154476.1 RluA family pseudouridine synthase [Pseudomonadota bacterium]
MDIPAEHLVEITVLESNHGQRLDQFLAQHAALFSGDFSRAMFQELIVKKKVLVNDLVRKNNYRVRTHELIQVSVPAPIPSELVPEPVEFTLVYEDDYILVLSKPPGIVVHPACGNLTGTLVHGLLHHCTGLSGINGQIRPGIVHRLDKDTSGVMVVAKNDEAHHSLSSQFKNKTAKKTYYALLDGVPSGKEGKICSSIGRHPVNRKKMAVVAETRGKAAVTNWKVMTRFDHNLLWAEIGIETGRTHQIRVHMASIGLPVAGDAVYGKKNDKYNDLGIKRQCLHASRLSFSHPATNQQVTYVAELSPDLAGVLELLQFSVREL